MDIQRFINNWDRELTARDKRNLEIVKKLPSFRDPFINTGDRVARHTKYSFQKWLEDNPEKARHLELKKFNKYNNPVFETVYLSDAEKKRLSNKRYNWNEKDLEKALLTIGRLELPATPGYVTSKKELKKWVAENKTRLDKLIKSDKGLTAAKDNFYFYREDESTRPATANQPTGEARNEKYLAKKAGKKDPDKKHFEKEKKKGFLILVLIGIITVLIINK